MPITDLTGTTWLFNETVYFTSSNTYYINYAITCADSQYDQSGGTSLVSAVFVPQTLKSGSKGPPQPEQYCQILINTKNYTIFKGGSGVSGCIFEAEWSSAVLYKTARTSATTIDTITITGGTDVTNSGLISWLEANATQVEPTIPAVSISKITDSNNNTGYFTTQSYFTSDSTASSSTKTATSPNNATFSDTSLETGVSVHIHFTYANTASTYTLQVGTSTAKSVSLTSPWEANSIVTFTYDGTNWIQNDVRPVVRSIKVDNTVVTPDSSGLATLTTAINDYIDSQLTPAVVTDLTGTTWYFNDTITYPDNLHYTVRFTLPNYPSATGSSVYASTILGDEYFLAYVLTVGIDPPMRYDVYTPYQGWSHTRYKTIYFTGGTDVTNSGLISWLYDNATLTS